MSEGSLPSGPGGFLLLRSIPVIAAAIGLSNPTIPAPTRTAYATTVQKVAVARKIDPFTIVAIGWHESGWRSGLVSRDGEDHGIMQVRARYQGGCRGAEWDSDGCLRTRAMLLNGHENIRIAGRIIHEWRELCRRKTGRPALFHRWLAGYGGASRPKQGIWCGQKKVNGQWRDLTQSIAVQNVIRCRQHLIRKQPCRRLPRGSRPR